MLCRVVLFDISSRLFSASYNTATTISLLPLILGRSTTGDRVITDALQAFVQRRFPTRSTEYAPGSTDMIAYIACVDRIIECMVRSGNLTVVEVIKTCHLKQLVVSGEEEGEIKFYAAKFSY